MIIIHAFIHLMILAFIVALIASHYLDTRLSAQFIDIARIFTIIAIIGWFSMTCALVFAGYEAYRYYNLFNMANY